MASFKSDLFNLGVSAVLYKAAGCIFQIILIIGTSMEADNEAVKKYFPGILAWNHFSHGSSTVQIDLV